MTRTLNYAFLASLLALGASACGGTSSDEDAGPADAGDETPDAGTMGTDAGGEEDAGAAVDAGPQGCQMGCGIVELSVGILHVCGRRENGEVLCWGRNQESQLGDGRLRHEQCNDPGTEPEDCSSTPVNVRYLDGTRRLVIEDAVGLAVDGNRQPSQRIDVPAGGRAEAVFSVQFDEAGAHALEADIDGDRLVIDDRRASVVLVPPPVRINSAARSRDAACHRRSAGPSA